MSPAAVDEAVHEAPEMVLPFYLLADESASLSGANIDAINQQLAELRKEIIADPVVSDKAHFGIVAYSTDAATILPLSDLHHVKQIPLLAAGGITNYKAAFEHMKQQIVEDVERLKKQGTRVYRPSVFFISDGEPNGPAWESAYRDLVSDTFGYRPNIISFGVGGANRHTIARIGTLAAYQADDEVSIAAALKEFAKSLTKSVVQSASAAAAGKVGLVIPETPKGFVELDLLD